MSTKKIEEGSTAHQKVHGDAATDAGGPMGMGMTGTDAAKDPDQKSTHVKPNTVESTLPDGSPKYADPVKSKPATRSKRTGRYEVVTRISTATAYNSDGVATKRAAFEPGDVIELDADEAESLGAAVKPAR